MTTTTYCPKCAALCDFKIKQVSGPGRLDAPASLFIVAVLACGHSKTLVTTIPVEKEIA